MSSTLYSYRAVTDQGKFISGHMMALHRQDVCKKLQGQGLQLLSLRSQKLMTWLFNPGPVSVQQDLFTFCLYLEHFFQSGLPLFEGLKEMKKYFQNTFQGVLESLSQNLHQGLLLSEALSQHPYFFDLIFITVVQAGERTGDLGKAFSTLSVYVKKKQEWHKGIRQNLRYPFFVLCALLGALWGLFSFLVPSLLDFLLSFQVPLPWATRSLMAVAYCFSAECLPFLLMGVGFCGVVFCFFLKNRIWALKFYRFCLKLPWLGALWSQMSVCEFLYGFSLMAQQGIHIVEGLRIVRQGVRQPFLAYTLEQVEKDVVSGSKLSEALAVHPCVPGPLVRMVQVGEETGRLPQSLQQISALYTREIQEKMDGFLKLLEPVILCIFGIFLFWIVMGTFLPLYESLDKIYEF